MVCGLLSCGLVPRVEIALRLALRCEIKGETSSGGSGGRANPCATGKRRGQFARVDVQVEAASRPEVSEVAQVEHEALEAVSARLGRARLGVDWRHVEDVEADALVLGGGEQHARERALLARLRRRVACVRRRGAAAIGQAGVSLFTNVKLREIRASGAVAWFMHACTVNAPCSRIRGIADERVSPGSVKMNNDLREISDKTILRTYIVKLFTF